jgi:hypothetical protein
MDAGTIFVCFCFGIGCFIACLIMKRMEERPPPPPQIEQREQGWTSDHLSEKEGSGSDWNN